MSPAARTAVIVPLALAVSAIVARALLAHPSGIVASGLAQPVGVVTNWETPGALLTIFLALACAAAAAVYLPSLARIGERDAVPLACGVVAGLAAAWAWPAIFSSDVYAYAAYGEMARLGMGAYSHATLPQGNPIFDAAVWQWGNPPPACVYGPAFVAAAFAIVSLTSHLPPVAAIDGLRALASFSLLGAGAFAYAAYGGDRAARLRAAATIALNPAALWCAAEGHNDAVALCVALGGVALARTNAPLGAVVAAFSGTIKAPGIFAAIAAAVRDPRARAGAIAGAAATIAVSIPVLHAVTVHVAPAGHYAPQGSVQAIFGAFPPLSIAVAAIVAIALAIAGARQLARGSAEGWCSIALAAWVLIPNPYPWYGLWLLAVAAAAPRTRAANVAIALSLTSLLRYLPDTAGAPNEVQAIVLGIAASLPLAALLRKDSSASPTRI